MPRQSHVARQQSFTSARERMIETLEGRTLYSSGGLDPSFGSGELTSLPLAPAIAVTSQAVAVQTDGKVVVAGINAQNHLAVARYNADGTPDTTFGSTGSGLVVMDAGTVPAGRSATSLAIDSKGRI